MDCVLNSKQSYLPVVSFAAVGGEERCVTTLITAAKETNLPIDLST